MAASSSIQFYGLEQVMEAAENRNCAAWGIWQSRQFLFRYQDSDLEGSMAFLEKILESLANNNTTATYTIKFFDPEGNKPIIIKENTPCNGSFNFKLVQPEERMQLQQTYQANSPRIIGLIESIDQRLKKIEDAGTIDDDDDEPQPETPLETIGNILKNPTLLEQYIAIGRQLMGLQPQPGYVGNVPVNQLGQTTHRSAPADLPGNGSLSQQNTQPMNTNQQGTVTTVSEEEFLQRIGDALDTIRERNPRILEHMEKIAKLCKEKPQQFDSFITMLDLL